MLNALPTHANLPKLAVILLEDQHVAQLQVHVVVLMMNIVANLDTNVYAQEHAQDHLAAAQDADQLDSVNLLKGINKLFGYLS